MKMKDVTIYTQFGLICNLINPYEKLETLTKYTYPDKPGKRKELTFKNKKKRKIKNKLARNSRKTNKK